MRFSDFMDISCLRGRRNGSWGRARQERVDGHLESLTGAIVGDWISVGEVDLAAADHRAA